MERGYRVYAITAGEHAAVDGRVVHWMTLAGDVDRKACSALAGSRSRSGTRRVCVRDMCTAARAS